MDPFFRPVFPFSSVFLLNAADCTFNQRLIDIAEILLQFFIPLGQRFLHKKLAAGHNAVLHHCNKFLKFLRIHLSVGYHHRLVWILVRFDAACHRMCLQAAPSVNRVPRLYQNIQTARILQIFHVQYLPVCAVALFYQFIVCNKRIQFIQCPPLFPYQRIRRQLSSIVSEFILFFHRNFIFLRIILPAFLPPPCHPTSPVIYYEHLTRCFLTEQRRYTHGRYIIDIYDSAPRLSGQNRP